MRCLSPIAEPATNTVLVTGTEENGVLGSPEKRPEDAPEFMMLAALLADIVVCVVTENRDGQEGRREPI
jgi:hypothetical protein